MTALGRLQSRPGPHGLACRAKKDHIRPVAKTWLPLSRVPGQKGDTPARCRRPLPDGRGSVTPCSGYRAAYRAASSLTRRSQNEPAVRIVPGARS